MVQQTAPLGNGKTFAQCFNKARAAGIDNFKWYVLDRNLLYFEFKAIDDSLIDKMKKVFRECDCFRSFNTFAIDMNIQ